MKKVKQIYLNEIIADNNDFNLKLQDGNDVITVMEGKYGEISFKNEILNQYENGVFSYTPTDGDFKYLEDNKLELFRRRNWGDRDIDLKPSLFNKHPSFTVNTRVQGEDGIRIDFLDKLLFNPKFRDGEKKTLYRKIIIEHRIIKGSGVRYTKLRDDKSPIFEAVNAQGSDLEVVEGVSLIYPQIGKGFVFDGFKVQIGANLANYIKAEIVKNEVVFKNTSGHFFDKENIHLAKIHFLEFGHELK